MKRLKGRGRLRTVLALRLPRHIEHDRLVGQEFGVVLRGLHVQGAERPGPGVLPCSSGYAPAPAELPRRISIFGFAIAADIAPSI